MRNIYDNGDVLLGTKKDVYNYISRNKKNLGEEFVKEYNDMLDDIKDLDDNSMVAIYYENAMGYTIRHWDDRDIIETIKETEEKTILEQAILQEVDMNLECVFEDVNMDEDTKMQIVDRIINNEDGIWEALNIEIVDLIKDKLRRRLSYLRDKETCCELDKIEWHEFDILNGLYERGEL